MTDLFNRMGRSAFSYLSGENAGSEADFVGSIVDVGGIEVQVTKLLGEGGYAFIYAAKEIKSGKEYALKRFLAFEEAKVNEIIAEIKLHKEMKSCQDIVSYVMAASVDQSSGKNVNKEFLLLMELCSGGDLSVLLRKTGSSLSPSCVCTTMSSLCRGLMALHTRSPPVTHRDVKLENLLIDSTSCVKLCDLGSATSTSHQPNQDWSMNQRTTLEDDLAKYSTPMYRAPEMLDTWSNFPVNSSVDIWAAGCVLYTICFNKHPFDDSAKLAIVNGNYKIPADSRYKMYHKLIQAMLTVDPRDRPKASQVLEQLSAIAEMHGFKTRGPLDMQLPVVQDPQTPLQEHPPAAPPPTTAPSTPSTTPSAPPTTSSSIRGAAGSFFSRLKDTSKAVVASVQQSMAPKDLDFDCVTSRVAAMSFPAEGLESAYRNHIDDVRGMMESQHAGHYTVYNLAERTYSATRYPGGKLVHVPWPAETVPPLDTLLDLLSNILDFLSRDVRNVAVVHCLDGKSSTALVVCSLLLYCHLVSTPEDALHVFTSRRCAPLLSPSQRALLTHVTALVRASPPVLKSPFVNIANIVIEPIPLFNRASDGCRPYVEVLQGKEKVVSTLQEYNRMTGYSVTSGDDSATVPVNATVCGDVTIAVYHARQALGGLSKPTGIKMCQVQFHTNSFTPGKPSHVWSLNQVDGITEPVRYNNNFRLVLNCSTSDECSGKDVSWPLKDSKQLLFNSDQDFQETLRLIGGGGQQQQQRGNSKFFVGSPVEEPPHSDNTRTTVVEADLLNVKQEGGEDLLSSSSGASRHNNSQNNVKARSRGVSPTEELIAGVSEPGVPPPSSSSHRVSVDLLQQTPPVKQQNKNNTQFEFLADFGGPPNINIGLPANKPVPSSSSNDLSDIFGPSSSFDAPLLNVNPLQNNETIPRVISSPNLMTTSTNFDPFANLTNLTSGLSVSNQNLHSNTQPMASMAPTGGQQPRPGMAGGGQQQASMPGGGQQQASMPGGGQQARGRPGQASTLVIDLNLNARPQSSPSGPQMGPNYSRSLFENPNNSGFAGNSPGYGTSPSGGNGMGGFGGGNFGGVRPQVSEGAFGDLLGGFNPNRDANQNKTIGQMAKAEVAKNLSPDEAKIEDWKEGKSRNIRTLLCNLHKILWTGTRWNQCGMHELVDPSGVKKMYRKACLAVHPDKQMGTDNENLSKLIFMELNEAWSEFENDASQQNIFGK